MNIYKITFVNVEEVGYNADKKFFVSSKRSKEDKLYLPPDTKALFIPIKEPSELASYWQYGGGVDSCIRVGEMNDSFFSPVLSEADFVETEIKSRKNGTLLGRQG